MMRRFATGRLAALSTPARYCAGVEASVAAKAGGIDPMDRHRARLGKSPIAFASASSSEMRPRVAAAEAFDLAAAALPAPPNFCMVHISMDHENMLDAPEVVWHQLNKAAGGAGSAQRREGVKPTMVGGTVRQQRLGMNGYIEVMLGTIPDLVSTPFTFDDVPAELPADMPAPFMGVAMLDWRLTMRHMVDINQRLDSVSKLLQPHNAPLVGGVYPPAEAADVDEATQGNPGHKPGEEAAESLFFFNDSVLRGSAGAMLLHSDHVKADLVVTPPQIPVHECKVTKAEVSGPLWVISEIDGKPATETIRDVYETQLKDIRRSKLFVGLDGGTVSLSFSGDPKTGNLFVPLPPNLIAALEATPVRGITLTCDEERQDRESIARSLIQYAKVKQPTWASVTEEVTVQREGKHRVTAASACAMHWTNPNLYEVFRRDDVLTLSLSTKGGTTDQHAPSIAHRVLGGTLPSSGAYVAGQVMPLVGSTEGLPEELHPAAMESTVTTRASAHVVLRPVESVEQELAESYVAPAPAPDAAADSDADAKSEEVGPFAKGLAAREAAEEDAARRAKKEAEEKAKAEKKA